MSYSNREYCYEYFNCKEIDCVRRKKLSENCWDITAVQCKSHSPVFEKIKHQLGCRLEACKLCIYYKKHH